MSRKLIFSYVAIGLLLVWAAFELIPTIKFEQLTQTERETLKEKGKLNDLKSKIIKRGLDLQGGMHLVLEVNVPKLVNGLAKNKSISYYDFIEKVNTKYKENNNEDFLDLFLQEADNNGIRLARYYMNRGHENKDIIKSLRKEAKESVTRALEVIRNRVDQFGVSEPTIQRQGSKRIIVELAGVTDIERARNLIQSTALLEFKLLKDATIAQETINRIDKVIRKEKPNVDLIDTTTQNEKILEKSSEDKAVSLEDIFGITETKTKSDSSQDSSAIVDENIVAERPFSSLLRNLGRIGTGVPSENVYIVKKILNMKEVKKVIPADLEILWSNKSEILTTQSGEAKEFFVLYFVERESGLTGQHVTDAKATIASMSSNNAGQSVVHVDMDSKGAKIWSRLTGANIGKRVAIVLDNKVQMAPNIKSKIPGGRTVIEGLDNLEEAKDMEIVLKAGALPAPLDIIEERTIGASLGADSIRKGTMSVLIGLTVIIIFIVFYYKGSGLIAFTTLLLNMIFVLSVLAFLGATLTLPGIAGLVLTMGMSVDANVLIFERIREEYKKGKTVRSSVENGYSRAIITILDANLTTLIAALVLYQFGTGPIKGFAIVLFWGIIFNFVSGYFISKTIFTTITTHKVIKKLSI
ncbi:MAG: protein translocase subunit SecD [Candidatus Marinimicrobia bacterium]|nr:protein translocase subunit SecD [Candidatus Neomarinimicrobiota bacterium]